VINNEKTQYENKNISEEHLENDNKHRLEDAKKQQERIHEQFSNQNIIVSSVVEKSNENLAAEKNQLENDNNNNEHVKNQYKSNESIKDISSRKNEQYFK